MNISITGLLNLSTETKPIAEPMFMSFITPSEDVPFLITLRKTIIGFDSIVVVYSQ
jgi:hypothetical protein